MKVALAVEGQTPASMLRQGMEHVVQEADASVDGNRLRFAGLRSVSVLAFEEPGVGIRRKIASVEVQCQLDLGLVCITGHSGPAGGGCAHDGFCVSVEVFSKLL